MSAMWCMDCRRVVVNCDLGLLRCPHCDSDQFDIIGRTTWDRQTGDDRLPRIEPEAQR